MAKFFIDVVQDSPRTGLGIPLKPKKPLPRTSTLPTEPPFGFRLHFTGIERFLPRSMRIAKPAQGTGARVQAPMRFLLAPVIAVLCTPIELPRLHHQGDE